MLSQVGNVNHAWIRPVAAKEIRAILIRSILVALLILLVGALSCSIVTARTIRRPQLTLADRIDAEQRLWNLGYWAGQVDGDFDSASQHALVAFQKVERRARTGILTPIELTAIRVASRPSALHGKYFHVEIVVFQYRYTRPAMDAFEFRCSPQRNSVHSYQSERK